MRDIKVTDEWLYKYIPVVDEAIINALEDNTGDTCEFSDHFDTRMERLIHREAQSWYAVYSGIPKRASIIVAAIVSMLLLTSMSVYASWYKIFETFSEEVSGGFNEYRYTLTTETYEREPRELQGVPEEYRETERRADVNGFSVIYENDLGEWIAWDQYYITSDSGLVLELNSEYEDMVVTQIHGVDLTVFIYPEGMGKTAYFEYENSVYVMLVDNVELEKIYEMFEYTFQIN